MANDIIFFRVLLFYITLIVLCIFNTSSQKEITYHGLYGVDEYREALKPDQDDQDCVWMDAKYCKASNESIITRNYYLDICKLVGLQTKVCCPIPMTANELAIKNINKICLKFSTLEEIRYMSLSNFEISYIKFHNGRPLLTQGIAGGKLVRSQEFPHMVLLGYGDYPRNEEDWSCGGSLISKRWILTAAHCLESSGNVARWARLGVLFRTVIERGIIDRPYDYKIVKHIIHPDYNPPSLYNDIALFCLGSNVQFSNDVRPICLNTDLNLTPPKLIATGWGRTSTAGPLSDHLLSVDLDIYPMKHCNESYSNDPKLRFGILPDSMICAGSFDGTKDSCMGDSGGPLQLAHAKYMGMYTQYGITSFGRSCADKDTPGVYTRVANYIPWIEKTVFSNSGVPRNFSKEGSSFFERVKSIKKRYH